jgi:hypothetical protein
MFARRQWITKTMVAVVSLIAVSTPAVWTCGGEAELTFFGWSDQHVAVNGDGQHLLPAIDAMNSLPGTQYPADIGGTVAVPAFVLGCGDITEWPTAAAKKTYEELLTRRLKFPSYDLVGNHDEGGNSPSETIKKWIRQRHGALSYTFDRAGLHFIVLFSHYDESLNQPAQPVSQPALTFLREDLAKLVKGTPVVVALHLCFDALTNREEFVQALGDANVVLVLGGHYHKAKVDRFRNINFVQLPSPAPGGPHEVTVIRITSDRLIAVPYQYQAKTWSGGPGKTLNVPIRGPRAG